MKRAFTLIELMVVMAIMGMMATLIVAGYSKMRRGMENRSVMQNVDQFIRSAYQRAQIDRQPVTIYFWNETTQEETRKQKLLVRGKAVAVRRSGRITHVLGELLCDEYGDLQYSDANGTDDEDTTGSGSCNEGSVIYMYKLNGEENTVSRSLVYENTHFLPYGVIMLSSKGRAGNLTLYTRKIKDENGVEWKVGDAYGFEFAEITLPDGYIFGSSYSSRAGISGEKVMRFDVSANSGDGAMSGAGGASIQVSRLARERSGEYSAEKVADSTSPTTSLN